MTTDAPEPPNEDFNRNVIHSLTLSLGVQVR
jgi:hypothetical protein